jgi:CRP-like cAMP-binding protein
VTAEVDAFVASHPLFAGLPAGVTSEIAACCRTVAYGPDELLLVEGQPADTLFLVQRGRVAIEIHGADRGTLVVETVETGGAVGWSWLFPPYRWNFDARALGPVGAVAADATCLRAKMDADDEFGRLLVTRVAGVLLERLQATRLRLLDLYGADRAG